MKYKISQMKEGEIEEVINFHNKHLGKRDFINKDEIYKRLNSNSGIFLTAKDNTKIVGIKLGFIDKDTCVGRGIAIEKKYRRLGIGKSLIKKFEEKLKKFPKVNKYIFASSTKEGVPFHTSLGYKPTILFQSKDKNLLETIDLEDFTVLENSYNKTFDVYQLYVQTEKEITFDYLHKLESNYSDIDIQYLFEKQL